MTPCPEDVPVIPRGVRMHEAASVRSPATSTTQARQLPSGR